MMTATLPPPIHIVAKPYRPSCRLIRKLAWSNYGARCSNRMSKAIAPPLGLVIAGSKFNSLATAQAWAANASFDSIQSICEIFSPASDSASCTAGIGPSPIKFGATPFSPYDIILAMTGIEYFETACSLARTKAAAPSFIPDGYLPLPCLRYQKQVSV